MGRAGNEVTTLELPVAGRFSGDPQGQLFARRTYECVPVNAIFASPQDKEIYELRVTGLDLFNALLDLVPVPEEIKTRAKGGRKIAERYEEIWFSEIRKTLGRNHPRFEYKGSTVNVLLKGDRHLFDVVLWYKRTPYTGNFKVTEKGSSDNIFGFGGFGYLLSAPEMTKGKAHDIELALPKEEDLAMMLHTHFKSEGEDLPAPREYFLISHNRKSKEDRIVPVTSMVSHINSPKDNTLQGQAHKAKLDLTRTWADSWKGMAELLKSHAAKRAHMHNLIEFGEAKFCNICVEKRWGAKFCHECATPLSALPEGYDSSGDEQLDAMDSGF